jgi:hypothetical protein
MERRIRGGVGVKLRRSNRLVITIIAASIAGAAVTFLVYWLGCRASFLFILCPPSILVMSACERPADADYYEAVAVVAFYNAILYGIVGLLICVLRDSIRVQKSGAG